MKYDNQLRYAVQVVRDYDGRHPLAGWLRDFFREHKQMGSRDRKTLSAMVYAFYRLGKNEFYGVESRIVAGLRATGQLPEVVEYFGNKYGQTDVAVESIFPWQEALSPAIEPLAFKRSFLSQPDLFIRIRLGFERTVTQKLQEAGVAFTQCDAACFRLPNTTPADKLIATDLEAVIQDKSSQLTGAILSGLQVRDFWDCCAGSGGKSLMVHDIFPEADITASDSRSSIITNLRERFAAAQVARYTAAVVDLEDSKTTVPVSATDLVVADVPCTGSGTWSRTPEQLYFFDVKAIGQYVKKQQQIIDRIVDVIRPGGYLLYITCSVFREENEDMATYISEVKRLRKLRAETIAGYADRADTMFAALFINEQS